jgi:hypothetical protein
MRAESFGLDFRELRGENWQAKSNVASCNHGGR